MAAQLAFLLQMALRRSKNSNLDVVRRTAKTLKITSGEMGKVLNPNQQIGENQWIRGKINASRDKAEKTFWSRTHRQCDPELQGECRKVTIAVDQMVGRKPRARIGGW